MSLPISILKSYRIKTQLKDKGSLCTYSVFHRHSSISIMTFTHKTFAPPSKPLHLYLFSSHKDKGEGRDQKLNAPTCAEMGWWKLMKKWREPVTWQPPTWWTSGNGGVASNLELSTLWYPTVPYKWTSTYTFLYLIFLPIFSSLNLSIAVSSPM